VHYFTAFFYYGRPAQLCCTSPILTVSCSAQCLLSVTSKTIARENSELLGVEMSPLPLRKPLLHSIYKISCSYRASRIATCCICCLNAAGKRSCLGEQLGRQGIFLFLVALLQNFSFRPPEGQDRIDVREEWGVTNEPSAYKVRIVVRDA